MPIRIQRKRIKGWHMPPNTIYAGRPGPYGNPYHVGELNPCGCPMSVADTIRRYIYYVEASGLWVKVKHELKGCDLACWCKEGDQCHCDYLLALANDNPGWYYIPIPQCMHTTPHDGNYYIMNLTYGRARIVHETLPRMRGW